MFKTATGVYSCTQLSRLEIKPCARELRHILGLIWDKSDFCVFLSTILSILQYIWCVSVLLPLAIILHPLKWSELWKSFKNPDKVGSLSFNQCFQWTPQFRIAFSLTYGSVRQKYDSETYLLLTYIPPPVPLCKTTL